MILNRKVYDSNENVELAKDLIDKIMQYDCSDLDIGDRVGHTGYIDFIVEEYLEGYDCMKGVDMYQRPFITIKSHFLYDDGTTENSCTTFFQRYANDSLLWMAAGSSPIMYTDGGMNMLQLQLVKHLLYDKEIVGCENIVSRKGVVTIRLGYSLSKG
jgi:hypothetical protein